MKATSPALYNSEGPTTEKKSNNTSSTTSEFRRTDFEAGTIGLSEKEVNNFFREKQPAAANKSTPKLKDPIEFENFPTYFAACENSGNLFIFL